MRKYANLSNRDRNHIRRMSPFSSKQRKQKKTWKIGKGVENKQPSARIIYVIYMDAYTANKKESLWNSILFCIRTSESHVRAMPLWLPLSLLFHPHDICILIFNPNPGKTNLQKKLRSKSRTWQMFVCLVYQLKILTYFSSHFGIYTKERTHAPNMPASVLGHSLQEKKDREGPRTKWNDNSQ